MSKLTRLAATLAKVQARIANIEASYPTLAQYKSYSKGFGELSTTYQDFGPIANEYRSLLAQEEALQEQIDALNGTESASYVAAFSQP